VESILFGASSRQNIAQTAGYIRAFDEANMACSRLIAS
jgi:hypothetical protein